VTTPPKDPNRPELPVGAVTPDGLHGSFGVAEVPHSITWVGGTTAVPPRCWAPAVADDAEGAGEAGPGGR